MSHRGKDRRGLDVWELRISLGYDAKSGSYPRITERFHGPKTNATRRLHEPERKREGGPLPLVTPSS